MAWRTVAVLGATASMLLGVLAGCGQEDRSTDEPTHGPTSRPTSRPSDRATKKPSDRATNRPTGSDLPEGCRQLPVSSGPASSVAELRVAVPGTVPSGGEVQAQVSLHVRHDGGRIVAVAAHSQLLVVRGRDVVAVSAPVSASGSTLQVPLQLRAGAVRRAQVVPDTVRLVGCAPGASQPLPPGRYGVVAVLAYGQDPLNAAAAGGAHQFQLVSAPASLTVV
jgi:hypothetical protein